MGGKTSRGAFGDRRIFPKANERIRRAIKESNHRQAARFGVKMGASILGVEPIITGVEMVAKAYQVSKHHPPGEARDAALMELATSFAAGGAGQLVTGLAGSALNEDQKRIVSAAVSTTVEEMLEPMIDRTKGWE